MPLKIVAAAVITYDALYTGKRHHDCMVRAWNDGEVRIKQHQQGFLTSDDTFVNREQAAKIAYCAGQIATPKRELFSEDLW